MRRSGSEAGPQGVSLGQKISYLGHTSTKKLSGSSEFQVQQCLSSQGSWVIEIGSVILIKKDSAPGRVGGAADSGQTRLALGYTPLSSALPR